MGFGQDNRMTDTAPAIDSPPDDPVFLNSRREFLIIMAVWALCLLWVVPYSYIFGYHTVTDPADLKLVLGMPSWVVWGVGAPWMVANVITIVLCLWVIKEDDLEA
jgi:hypothetical protein